MRLPLSLRFRPLAFTAFVASVLSVLHSPSSVQAQDSTPSFMIVNNAATMETSPVSTTQAFSKQWQIKADTAGTIAAIEVLTLDLPGQVFITYASSTNASLSTVIGEIKVFGASDVIVNSVSVASKRAMKGAKLAVTKTNSSATATIVISEQLLTEVVLWRKTALKKVITNGWADVVIADDVLFTKKKEDYAFPNYRRALLADAAAAAATKSFTVQESARQHISSSTGTGFSLTNSNWTILWPTGDSHAAVAIDAQVTGLNAATFTRVDSDLLPEGSIGMVASIGGEVDVAGTLADTAERELLTLRPKANATASTVNTTAIVKLAPTVSLTTITKSASSSDGKQVEVVVNHMNATIADNAVTLFLNGTGNLFVLANASFVYVDDANFRIAGSGFLQVEIGEIRAAAGVTVDMDSVWMDTSYMSTTGIAIRARKTCMWSPTSYGMSYPSDVKADTIGDVPRCEMAKVPVKVGGTKAATAAATTPLPVGKSAGASAVATTPLPVGKSAGASAAAGLAIQGTVLAFCAVALAM